MRNPEELLSDLSELTSMEWNSVLAEEYKMELNDFIRVVSNYNYQIASEDNIHHKMKPVFSLKDKIVETPSLTVSSYIRDLGDVEFNPGECFDNIIFCGFIFNKANAIANLVKNCVYYNCISTNSVFGSSQYVQDKFIDCDFSETDFSECIVTKCVFYDCSFRKARFISSNFYDCVFYNCDFNESDMDASLINSSFIHNCSFNQASIKSNSYTSNSISYCSYSNSSLRDTSFYDCNLININFISSNLDGVVLIGTESNNALIDEMYSDIFSK